MFDNFVVIRDVQLDCIDRGLERPTKLMFPHSFHDDVAQVFELVGVAAGPVSTRHERRVDLAVDRLEDRFVLGVGRA